MSGIDRREVERIAGLARLSLAEDEADALAGDLDQILAYAQSLEALDTEAVEPTAHVIALAMPTRPDVPAEPIDAELAVSNAPRSEGTAFVVPKVLDSDEEG